MLPEKFKERMKMLLGDEYEAFSKAMQEEPERAFRTNLIKVSRPDEIKETLASGKIPYEAEGYFLKQDIQIGKSPLHHAGAIYVQDPGAMAALAAININKTDKVIDLCAAPGGKSSKLAEAASCGFVISNEYVPKRAKLLVGNFERLGVKNAVITSLDTAEFSKLFDGYFDVVVADVPCSGEGMFRKNPDAISEWSEEAVLACKKRQAEILENAYRLVAPDGTLLYSTCTFSTEENEDNIIEFLDNHPDFSLGAVDNRLIPYTAPAIDTSGGRYPEIGSAARRFYPHVSRGEGQFVAVLKRSADVGARGITYKEKAEMPSRDEALALERFFDAYFKQKPDARLVKHGQNPVLISHGCPLLPKSVFMQGVLVGEIRNGLVFPSHQLFSAYGELFKGRVDLVPEDERLKKYLLGEEISVDKDLKGWCVVSVLGIPIGGGKASGGTLKNHYPKGLRNKN